MVPGHYLPLLTAAFLFIALVYASVGFGGGSSYTAALALAGLSAAVIPVLSLSCNLIVVGGGVWHFARRGHLRLRLVWPFLAGGIPAAYLAGRLQVDPRWYFLMLGFSLVAAGSLLLVKPSRDETRTPRAVHVPVAVAIGAALGAISGLVGIGGGVFLAPILLLLGWGRPKEVAAAAALFILVNSAAGLAGHLAKPAALDALPWLLPLGLAVLLGGQAGSRLGAGRLSPLVIRRVTSVLVLAVGLRLVYHAVPMFIHGGPL